MNLLSKPLPHLLLCCLVMAVFWLAPQADAALVINEIMGDPNQDWNGDGAYNYREDEWIEVMNTGTESENLSNYWLRDITGDDLHLQLWGNLDPLQVAVFYGSDAINWQLEQGLTGVGFSINNSGDTMELLKTDPDQSGALIVVQSITLLAHEVDDDRSSGLGFESGLWELYDALNPYNGASEPQGNDCQPTPGEENVCVPLVPVEPTAWGAVKSQYR